MRSRMVNAAHPTVQHSINTPLMSSASQLVEKRGRQSLENIGLIASWSVSIGQAQISRIFARKKIISPSSGFVSIRIVTSLRLNVWFGGLTDRG